MLIQYQCPNCGADMEFDAKTGQVLCQSCGFTEKAENMPNPSEEKDTEAFNGNYEDFVQQTRHDTFAEEAVVEYVCKNCGAVVMAGEETMATHCEFCGSPVILGDRLKGQLRPANVIPFKIPKKEAEEAFRKWCKNGLLTPNGFKDGSRVKEIVGIYIPFWLFDVKAYGEVNAHCTRVSSYERGDYIITETKHYDVFRKVDLDYGKIPADASQKMDDRMMDMLEPFSYEGLKKFQMPYLSGYIAEKYDFTDKELFPRVQERVKKYTEGFIRSTIKGYSTTNLTRQYLQQHQKKAEYTLLPVWMFCYDYKNAEHNFYMNGQTGKIIGKPPLDKKKILFWFLGISAGSYVLMAVLIGLIFMI